MIYADKEIHTTPAEEMDPKPVPKGVVKPKSDPEALLNDLSSSLKSLQSTVRTWTAAAAQTRTPAAQPVEMRPARLGLGAKPERKVAGPDSVTGSLALTKQLVTAATATTRKKSGSAHEHNAKQQKRKGFDDDDERGRASMIAKKK